MSSPALLAADSKVPALALARDMDLSEAGRALLGGTMNLRAAIATCAEARLLADGVRLMARGLSGTLLIAWGEACLEEGRKGRPAPPDQACLEAVRTWRARPEDGPRQAAAQAAEQAGLGSPAAWLAAAVGWTGGSLAPPDVDPVPPPDFLPAKAVATALILSAATDPDGGTARLMGYLRRGAKAG